MAASISDTITKVSSGVRPVSTTVQTIRNSGATTLDCADLTGWSTTEVVFFITYSVDGQGNVVADSQSDWKGIVSGTDINNLTLTGGTDNGNAPGDIVEMLPTAEYAKQLATNILTHADQDGTLKVGAVDNAAVLASDVVTTVKILDANVTTGKLANASITPNKLSTGITKATVATIETTTSTSYADLATTSDSVTVTIGSNGIAVVLLTSNIKISGATDIGLVSFVVSGANTLAAADTNAIEYQSYAANTEIQLGTSITLTGLAAGSTTFKMKYRVTGGTGTFKNRNITVLPL